MWWAPAPTPYPCRVHTGHFRRSLLVTGLAGVALLGLSACGSSGHASAPTTAPRPAVTYKALLGAGSKLLGEGNTNAAEQLFQQAIQDDPGNAIGYYDLGVVYQREGQSGEARQQYQMATKADAHYVPALYNEAIVVSGSDPQQAASLYRQVIVLQPDSPTALLNLGLLDVNAHQDSEAVSSLRQAVKLDPALGSRVPAALRSQVTAG